MSDTECTYSSSNISVLHEINKITYTKNIDFSHKFEKNKTSSPKINYTKYECICLNKSKKTSAKCNLDDIKCIITNYIIFLKSRNLFIYMSDEYIENLNCFAIYHRNKEYIKLAPITRMSNNSENSNSSYITLYLKSPLCKTELAKYIDILACKEFVDFINKHVYCPDFNNEILLAQQIYKKITQNKY
uniref:Uncharacterized protein n=1 Tax=Faxonius propinquus nudivirus TaxID=3139431 RepID=A0AAU8GFC6_9VIRU